MGEKGKKCFIQESCLKSIWSINTGPYVGVPIFDWRGEVAFLKWRSHQVILRTWYSAMKNQGFGASADSSIESFNNDVFIGDRREGFPD
jgi:hypothetical protein